MDQERRKYKRISINSVAQWKTFESSNKPADPYAAIVKNVSSGGVLISSYSVINVGDKIRLKFVLPSKESITCVCKVVWVNTDISTTTRTRYDFGAEFINIDDVSLKSLKAFAVLNFLKK
jgi:c-di-GMP-binding flagellar brake protein YcgR